MKKLFIGVYCAAGLISILPVSAEARRAYSYSGSSDEQVEYVYEVEGEPKKAQPRKNPVTGRKNKSKAASSTGAKQGSSAPGSVAGSAEASLAGSAATAPKTGSDSASGDEKLDRAISAAVSKPQKNKIELNPAAPVLPRSDSVPPAPKPQGKSASEAPSVSALPPAASPPEAATVSNAAALETNWLQQAIQHVVGAIQSAAAALLQIPRAWTTPADTNNLAGGHVLGAYTPTPSQFPEQSAMYSAPPRSSGNLPPSSPRTISTSSKLNSKYEFIPERAGTFKPMLMKKAGEGDVRAAFALGVMYMDGQGTRKDMAEARKWLEKAHAANVQGSAARLGAIYVSTSGRDKKLYQKGCDLLLEGTKEHDVLAYETLATIATRNGKKDFAMDMWRMAKQFGSKVADSKLKELGET